MIDNELGQVKECEWIDVCIETTPYPPPFPRTFQHERIRKPVVFTDEYREAACKWLLENYPDWIVRGAEMEAG